MKNIDNNIEQAVDEFFKEHTIRFQKTKKQEWKVLESKLSKEKRYQRPIFRYAMSIAAMFLIILGAVTVWHTKTYRTKAGEQQTCVLPDGSRVRLNVASELSYHPFEWYLSRHVKLRGEAFFEVQKGSRFTVQSDLGITQVVGTSFNVYAHEDAYKVACVTGKVQVNTQGKQFELTEGEAVVWDAELKKLTKTKKQQEAILAWQKQRLLFKAEHLRRVFNALERQYNVYIAYYPTKREYQYSGNISLENNLENNLSIVCKPFRLKWVEDKDARAKETKKLYIIK